jgi:hypothetical protein
MGVALVLRHYAKRSVRPSDYAVVGLDQALREADRFAGFDHVAFHGEPLPDLRGADEIDRKGDCRHPRRPAAHDLPAAIGHRAVRKGCDQSAVNESLLIGMWLGHPQSENHGLLCPFGIERLPWIGDGTFLDIRCKPFGDIAAVHGCPQVRLLAKSPLLEINLSSSPHEPDDEPATSAAQKSRQSPLYVLAAHDASPGLAETDVHIALLWADVRPCPRRIWVLAV